MGLEEGLHRSEGLHFTVTTDRTDVVEVSLRFADRFARERGVESRTFEFEPHLVAGHSVYFYAVQCFDRESAHTARCIVNLRNEFHSGDPSRSFSVSDTSDVPTALWAAATYREPETPLFQGRSRDWLESLHEHDGHSSLEIDGSMVYFRFSGPCIELSYRIVGDNEGSKAIEATPGGYALSAGGDCSCTFHG
ncbi:MAG: hypothetical protein AAFZ18_08460 [Myxococcota bacterium]